MRNKFFIPVLCATIAACGKSDAPAPAAAAPKASAALLTPDPAALKAQGPDSFLVRVTASTGVFDIKVHRDWAPNGSDRLYYLVSNGYYDGIRFFRVVDGFMAQFGMAGDPAVGRVWENNAFPDDPVKHGNKRGVLTFATRGPNTRTTQLFINFGDNTPLDAQGFSGVGEVVAGMDKVDAIFKGYGEQPNQGSIGSEGNAYLQKSFPQLSYIVNAKVAEEWKKK